jgi:two-component system OmpR family response regulator
VSEHPDHASSHTILVVDDEVRIREVIQLALEREGFRVRCASDTREARLALTQLTFSLIVLDIMLPDGDGLAFCRELRARSNTPILFVSARSDEIDRILGLEMGGDDYLTKPFSPRELVARVKAVLRRAGGTSEPDTKKNVLQHGVVTVDLEQHRVSVMHGDKSVTLVLTPTELGLLASLFERPGVVLSRNQLMKRAYTYDNLVTERTIDTHVRRVRAKFREFGFDPISTVHGVGYRAYDPVTESA